MQNITIWHNPRCSKSRAGLAYLQDKGIEPNVVKYLDNPPSPDELKDILSKLGMSPKELMRTKEAIYKELGLKGVDDEEALIEAMCQNPKLIERPIVINANKAVVARPAEKIEEIL